ncbi:MAG: NIPSNAP family protein [Halioglobus sp.]
MFVEERIYTLIPGGANEFLKLYEEEGMSVQLRYLKKLVGYYRAEFGPLNQIVHLWAHETFEQRLINRDEMRADPEFQAYWSKVKKLVVKQESKILLPAKFFEEKLNGWLT